MPYITVTMTTILYIIMLIAWKMLYANRLSDFVQSLVYYGDDGNRVDNRIRKEVWAGRVLRSS